MCWHTDARSKTSIWIVGQLGSRCSHLGLIQQEYIVNVCIPCACFRLFATRFPANQALGWQFGWFSVTLASGLTAYPYSDFLGVGALKIPKMCFCCLRINHLSLVHVLSCLPLIPKPSCVGWRKSKPEHTFYHDPIDPPPARQDELRTDDNGTWPQKSRIPDGSYGYITTNHQVHPLVTRRVVAFFFSASRRVAIAQNPNTIRYPAQRI